MENDIVVTTLRIPKYMHEELLKIANKRCDSLNSVMKLAIEYFLKNKT